MAINSQGAYRIGRRALASRGLSRSHRRGAGATAGQDLNHRGGMSGTDRRARRVARPCIRERWRHAPIMKLLPLDTPERIELVAGWLGKAENYKWLDFGNGVQRVTPITLKIMSQRDVHVFRIYTAG